MLSSGDISLNEGPLVSFDVSRGFGRAVLLGLLGTAAFVAAYEVWPRIRIPRLTATDHSLAPAASTVRRASTALIIVGGSLYLARLAIAGSPLATLRTLASGRSSIAANDTGQSAYLSDGPLLFACAATLEIVFARRPLTRSAFWRIIVLVVVPVAAFYLEGNRRLILPSVFTPLIANYLVTRRRPAWRSIVLVLPIAFLILATIPLERSLGAREYSQGGAFGIFERAFQQPFQGVATFFTQNDTEMLPALALEVQTLQKPGDYYFGRATVGDLLLSPVPSAVIPGKPLSARNSILVRIFGTPCEATGGLCPDFSAVGTFYQDFWYIGAVVGMAALGIFSSALWERHREQPGDPFRLIAAASWTVSLPILIRAGFMPAFQWWLEFVLPIAAALWYIRSESRSRSQRAPAALAAH